MSVQEFDQVLDAPHMIGEARFHLWRDVLAAM
jgi:hypothetical protein